jgi:tetratricopeptide (TPR) repeat protein
VSELGLPNKVIYVSAELAGTQELFSLLDKQGVRVLTAVDLSTALYQLNNALAEVLIIHSEFPEVRGIGVAQKIRDHRTPERAFSGIIIIQTRKEIAKGESMLQQELGGIENISYPFKAIQIIQYLQRAMQWRKQEIAFHDLNSKVLDYHRKSGQFDKALDAVKRKLPELGAKGSTMLLDLYRDAGKFDEALQMVDGLMARTDKDDIRLINAKAQILMKLGKLSDAKEWLEKADKLAPENISRLKNMTDVYLEQKDPDSAVNAMKKIVKANPEDPEMKFGLFDKLIDKGYAEHAKKLCHDTTMPEEIVRYYNNKGVLLNKEGDNAAAINCYEQALIFFPSHKENHKIYFNLALAHLSKKEPSYLKNAYTALKKVVGLEPSFEKGKNLLQQVAAAMAKQVPKSSKQPAAEAKPADAKPADAKPADAKPAAPAPIPKKAS